MPILTKRAVVAAKIEVAEGTSETLAAGDANFLVVDPKFEVEVPMFNRNNVDASLSPYAMIAGTQMATLSFKVEVRGSGSPGTAPALGKLLKGCGFGETVVASTSVTYAPTSASISSLTIALYRDGIKKQMRGARGNVKYVGKAGEPGMLEFEFKGVYDGVSDVSILTGSGIETTLPPALLTAAFAVGGFAAKLSNITIDMANKLAVRPDINKAEGWFSCVITGREPKGSFDPEMELVATHDFFTKWKTNVLATLTFAHTGSAGNIITVTAPKLQYVKLGEGDRDGVQSLGVDFLLSRSAAGGNDELSIAFT